MIHNISVMIFVLEYYAIIMNCIYCVSREATDMLMNTTTPIIILSEYLKNKKSFFISLLQTQYLQLLSLDIIDHYKFTTYNYNIYEYQIKYIILLK